MKILYLFPKTYYEKKMSIGRVLYGEAMERIEGVEFVWWGPGWEGYDDATSVRENLKKTSLSPDVIWAYKPELCVDITNRDCPLVVCYNESWPHIPGKAQQEADDCKADLIVCHHESDMDCFDGKTKHIPHGAPYDFACLGRTAVKDRPVDSIVTGVQSPEIYPLRANYKSAIRNGRINGVVRNHPGYRLRTKKECIAQHAAYGLHLGQAKMSLCCTSKYKYLLAKIIESMMTGCLVVTDQAEDSWFEQIRPFVLTIEQNSTEDDIVDIVKTAHQNIEHWSNIAQQGQEFAINNLTTTNYAKRLLACIEEEL